MSETTVQHSADDQFEGSMSQPSQPAREAAAHEAAHEDRHTLNRRVIAELRADGLVQEEQLTHLRLALQTSRNIGAAIGIVMAELGVSEDEAFAVLSKASQDSNRKLSALAQGVVDAGTAGFPPA